MSSETRSKLRCALLAASRNELRNIRSVIVNTASENDIDLVLIDDGARSTEALFAELNSADLVVCLFIDPGPNVVYEVGLAQALGKPMIFVISDEITPPFFITNQRAIVINRTSSGLARLSSELKRLFDSLSHRPERLQAMSSLNSRSAILPLIDLDRLEPREFENLCFELLTQMGFRRVNWGEQLLEIDAVATLPRKDPDGFEFSELWLISMGIRLPARRLIGIASDPDYLIHRVFKDNLFKSLRGPIKPEMPVTLLIIQIEEDPSIDRLIQELRQTETRVRIKRSDVALRVRHWDREQLVRLVHQYPQIASKYFSEEGRIQSKARKTVEQLYLENSDLNEKYRNTIAALGEEHEKRVRAERDSVWKDVAFTAAHKLGNPIFALETDLQGIKRKISSEPVGAAEIANEMELSIEKAKVIIEQFKSLTKAQQITARPLDLIPIVTNSARVARDNGVNVEIIADKNRAIAIADPIRMAECFDELFANSLHWFDKDNKTITVKIETVSSKDLPSDLSGSKDYLKIKFEDNGRGIPQEKKADIFAAFYTTYPHGTGLGLSLVQRVIEGHGGLVREVGAAGGGAVFEISSLKES